MNNNFSNYIKKAKISALSKLIGFFLLVLVVVLIGYATIPFLVIPCFLILVGIIFYITTDKERKRTIKYNLGVDVDNNVYVPLVLDIDYLKKLSNEFNNTIDLPNNFESLVSYVQYMIDNKQMIFVEKNFKLDEIVSLINDLMKCQNINYNIDKNDIIKNDDEIIKLRRKDKIINDFHDLAIIRSILENNQLELVRFFAPNEGFSKLVGIDGYILTVVPIGKINVLKKYQIELANNLNYK